MFLNLFFTASKVIRRTKAKIINSKNKKWSKLKTQILIQGRRKGSQEILKNYHNRSLNSVRRGNKLGVYQKTIVTKI